MIQSRALANNTRTECVQFLLENGAHQCHGDPLASQEKQKSFFFFISLRRVGRSESCRFSDFWYLMTHTGADPPQISPETRPGVAVAGAGRHSCCAIRLDSELMGLPHHPGPVLLTESVSERGRQKPRPFLHM